jgi:RNA polymerase-binding transcription factor DksA
MKKRPINTSAKRTSPEARPSGRDKTAVQTKPRAQSRAKLPAGIDPKWAWHYRVLVTLRDRLMRETNETQAEATAPIEPHSSHPADSATDEFDHDLALVVLSREQNALTEITDAIERMRNGTYGVCMETRLPIPAARLRALPWCRYSREVEERLEKAGAVPRPRVARAQSLRGPGSTIPGTGEIPREGTENEPKEADEPSAGTATVEDVLREAEETESEP